MKKGLKSIIIWLTLLATSCSSAGSSKNANIHPHKRITQEQSQSIAFSSLEYSFAEHGYQSTEAVACLGDEEYVGIVYTDYSSFVQDENNNYYAEAGFFQVIPSLESTSHLLEPSMIDETNQLIATDNDGNQFIITKSVVEFESFSFIVDDWYNVVKRVGEMVLEFKSFENKKQYYDYDISCYSYDKEEWVFKSDKDIKEFNVEAIGLYSDYTKVYTQAVRMMNELVELQDKSSLNVDALTYVVVSGELLRQSAFREQKGMINGYLLSDILATKEMLKEDQFIYLNGNDVEIITDTTKQQAQMRVEQGIVGIITNCLLLVGEVTIIATSWGVTSIPMGFAIAATITASCSIVYGLFNIGECISNVQYGSQGDIESKAVNYLKDGFANIFGSQEAGEIAYNVWGMANTIVSAILSPQFGLTKVLAGGAARGDSFGQITLGVIRTVAVRLAQAAIVSAGSTIDSIVAGELTRAITKNDVASAYARDFTRILSAIRIGIGLGILEKRFDFAGLKKYDVALHLKEIYGDEWKKEVYDKLREAGNKVGPKLKEQALDDILNHGASPDDYGLDMSDPYDKTIIDFIKVHKRFPSFANGDGIQCEFSHGVDVQRIVDAVINGKIPLNVGVDYVSNPLNGMLTSHENHLNILHGGNFNNYTDYNIIMNMRPDTQSTILSILTALGLA